jgi:hypothetical protein
MSKYLTPVLVLVVALLAITLVFKGGQVITGMAPQQNVTSAPAVNIGNIAPIVSSINCAAGGQNITGGDYNITLSANASTEVTCNATASDDNGYEDVTGASGAFYDSGGPTCTDDVKSCYQNATCEPGPTTGDLTRVITCKFYLKFNADNTTKSGNWTAFMKATDAGSLTGNNTRGPHYVSELLAINVPATFDLGIVYAGFNQTDANKTLAVSNFGNVMIDLLLNGTNLTCSGVGTIPLGYLKYYCTNVSGVYTGATTLSTDMEDSRTACQGFDLGRNVAAGASTTLPGPANEDTEWGIGAPVNTRGICTGTVQLTAISSS